MYPIHRYSCLDSTNVKAKQLADEGALHGTAIIADNQTSGRGRLGKSWHTVGGLGLYCSLIVRPQIEVTDYSKLTLVSGLAVAEALWKIAGVKPTLKWPNDVLFNSKKCAGILAESSALNLVAEERFAIIGIGVNVNHGNENFPSELHDTATSLALESDFKDGEKYAIEDVFSLVQDGVMREVSRFEKQGFRDILKDWRKYDHLLGKEMECVSTTGDVIKGISLGPDLEGILHVRDASSRIHEVLSGDVRLARTIDKS